MINPSHIDTGIPIKEQLTSVVDVEEFSEKIHMQDTAYQLVKYQLNPPKKKEWTYSIT